MAVSEHEALPKGWTKPEELVRDDAKLAAQVGSVAPRPGLEAIPEAPIIIQPKPVDLVLEAIKSLLAFLKANQIKFDAELIRQQRELERHRSKVDRQYSYDQSLDLLNKLKIADAVLSVYKAYQEVAQNVTSLSTNFLQFREVILKTLQDLQQMVDDSDVELDARLEDYLQWRLPENLFSAKQEFNRKNSRQSSDNFGLLLEEGGDAFKESAPFFLPAAVEEKREAKLAEIPPQKQKEAPTVALAIPAAAAVPAHDQKESPLVALAKSAICEVRDTLGGLWKIANGYQIETFSNQLRQSKATAAYLEAQCPGRVDEPFLQNAIEVASLAHAIVNDYQQVEKRGLIMATANFTQAVFGLCADAFGVAFDLLANDADQQAIAASLKKLRTSIRKAEQQFDADSKREVAAYKAKIAFHQWRNFGSLPDQQGAAIENLLASNDEELVRKETQQQNWLQQNSEAFGRGTPNLSLDDEQLLKFLMHPLYGKNRTILDNLLTKERLEKLSLENTSRLFVYAARNGGAESQLYLKLEGMITRDNILSFDQMLAVIKGFSVILLEPVIPGESAKQRKARRTCVSSIMRILLMPKYSGYLWESVGCYSQSDPEKLLQLFVLLKKCEFSLEGLGYDYHQLQAEFFNRMVLLAEDHAGQLLNFSKDIKGHPTLLSRLIENAEVLKHLLSQMAGHEIFHYVPAVQQFLKERVQHFFDDLIRVHDDYEGGDYRFYRKHLGERAEDRLSTVSEVLEKVRNNHWLLEMLPERERPRVEQLHNVYANVILPYVKNYPIGSETNWHLDQEGLLAEMVANAENLAREKKCSQEDPLVWNSEVLNNLIDQLKLREAIAPIPGSQNLLRMKLREFFEAAHHIGDKICLLSIDRLRTLVQLFDTIRDKYFFWQGLLSQGQRAEIGPLRDKFAGVLEQAQKAQQAPTQQVQQAQPALEQKAEMAAGQLAVSGAAVAVDSSSERVVVDPKVKAHLLQLRDSSRVGVGSGHLKDDAVEEDELAVIPLVEEAKPQEPDDQPAILRRAEVITSAANKAMILLRQKIGPAFNLKVSQAELGRIFKSLMAEWANLDYVSIRNSFMNKVQGVIWLAQLMVNNYLKERKPPDFAALTSMVDELASQAKTPQQQKMAQLLSLLPGNLVEIIQRCGVEEKRCGDARRLFITWRGHGSQSGEQRSAIDNLLVCNDVMLARRETDHGIFSESSFCEIGRGTPDLKLTDVQVLMFCMHPIYGKDRVILDNLLTKGRVQCLPAPDVSALFVYAAQHGGAKGQLYTKLLELINDDNILSFDQMTAVIGDLFNRSRGRGEELTIAHEVAKVLLKPKSWGWVGRTGYYEQKDPAKLLDLFMLVDRHKILLRHDSDLIYDGDSARYYSDTTDYRSDYYELHVNHFYEMLAAAENSAEVLLRTWGNFNALPKEVQGLVQRSEVLDEILSKMNEQKFLYHIPDLQPTLRGLVNDFITRLIPMINAGENSSFLSYYQKYRVDTNSCLRTIIGVLNNINNNASLLEMVRGDHSKDLVSRLIDCCSSQKAKILTVCRQLSAGLVFFPPASLSEAKLAPGGPQPPSLPVKSNDVGFDSLRFS